MNLKQYSGGGRKPSENPVLLGVGAVAVIVVIAGAYLFADATTDDRAVASPATTIPVVVVNPNDLPSPDNTQAPVIPGDEYDENFPTSIPQEIDHDGSARPDYSGVVIPADQLPVVFPTARSGLATPEFDRARQVGGEFVTALMRGTGREKFTVYSAGDWPDPRMADMTVDFTYASVTPGYSDLIRTVVVYHGTNTAEIPVQQARVSQYLRRGSNGSLTPVPLNDLPTKLQNSDPLLYGETILG